MLTDVMLSFCVFFFFVKQKTAYEMRISDWSSDVCSSDLPGCLEEGRAASRSRYLAAAGITATSSDRRRLHDCARNSAGSHCFAKIGRASCRERVCQYV